MPPRQVKSWKLRVDFPGAEGVRETWRGKTVVLTGGLYDDGMIRYSDGQGNEIPSSYDPRTRTEMNAERRAAMTSEDVDNLAACADYLEQMVKSALGQAVA